MMWLILAALIVALAVFVARTVELERELRLRNVLIGALERDVIHLEDRLVELDSYIPADVPVDMDSQRDVRAARARLRQEVLYGAERLGD